MVLADHAQVADGKLFISGGGWSSRGAGSLPCSVAVLFHVPWQETDKKTEFVLRLIDEDGRPVVQPNALDDTPVHIKGSFTARRPPDWAPGAEVNVPMTFNAVLDLKPNQRYSWTLEVNGQTDDAWRASFETRQAQQPVR